MSGQRLAGEQASGQVERALDLAAAGNESGGAVDKETNQQLKLTSQQQGLSVWGSGARRAPRLRWFPWTQWT